MYTYRTLIRDTLVDDATVKGLFGAGDTGSCWVNMENLTVTARYPGIIISYAGGQTVSNMDADEASIYLTTECKGTGTIHAHKEIGKFRSAILNVLDDKSLTGTAACFLLKKSSEVEGFDEEKKVWWLRIGFDGTWKQNFGKP